MNDQNAEHITHGFKLNERFVDVIRFKISTEQKKPNLPILMNEITECTEN